MRTLGFRTHILLAVAAAAAVIASLGRPWYAAPPALTPEEEKAIGELHGPVSQLGDAIGRWASESTGTTGWEALGTWGTVLAAFAGIAALGALGCLLPATQGVAREALRYGGFACLAIATWKLLDQPGPNDALELRYGAFVAAAASLFLVTSGAPVAAAPLARRRRPAPAYVPPTAPPVYETSRSAPPPGP
jgi:hypothetical protein